MNFTTSEWITPDQVAQMQSAVDRLRALALRVASSAPKFSSYVLNDGSVYRATIGTVADILAQVEILQRDISRVEGGARSYASWVSVAKALNEALSRQLGEQASWGLSDYLADVASQTATDVKEDVKAAAAIGLPVLLLLVVGLVLVKVL